MSAEKKRKYNDVSDLDELCKKILATDEADIGSALEYCQRFLGMLSESPPKSGAVVSSRARSR